MAAALAGMGVGPPPDALNDYHLCQALGVPLVDGGLRYQPRNRTLTMLTAGRTFEAFQAVTRAKSETEWAKANPDVYEWVQKVRELMDEQ